MSAERAAVSVDWLPRGLREELEQLGGKAGQVVTGTLSEAEFRAFRVPMGIYEQRESGRYMLRCRFPAGAIRPAHLRTLAEVSRRFGNGVLHATSRQDVQVHGVTLDAIHPALVALLEAGISTKGGGGNTVRNVAGCALAGACPLEAFDVTPHVQALTGRLLADPLSFQLPRKYKLAFSGCTEDCAGATVSDVGFVATRKDGLAGFAVYVGGGLGAHSRGGEALEEFVPVDEAPLVAEAVKRVFDRHGNRRNRNQARLRFLVERIGLAELRRLYAAERDELRAALPQAPAGPATRRGADSQPTVAPQSRPWREGAVTPEKRPGRLAVLVPLPLGNISADSTEKLAGIGERYGEGVLRLTQEQNLSLRGVGASELASLQAELETIGLAPNRPPVLRDMTVCAGASTCRLGICLSRGLAEGVREALETSGLDLDALGPVGLHISGCPNACGRHPLAQIGLYGVAKRVDGRLVPHYVVQLGGRLGVGRTRLAAGRWTIPARAVPGFLVDFLKDFAASGERDLDRFLDAQGAALADRLTARHASVPSFERDKNYYYDWSAEESFSLAGRGPGECGAGVFDLIELDLAGAAEALAEARYHRATTLASRALLVTRGEQPVSDAEALELFERLFIEEKLVDASFAGIVGEARALAGVPERELAFSEEREAAGALITAIRTLYDSMDASLRFSRAPGQAESSREAAPASANRTAPSSQPAPASVSPPEVKTHDFRGVACPLNYVKTKMALDRLKTGAKLLVLLNEKGAQSVPASIAKDGHAVLSLDQDGDHWRLLVEKGGR